MLNKDVHGTLHNKNVMHGESTVLLNKAHCEIVTQALELLA